MGIDVELQQGRSTGQREDPGPPGQRQGTSLGRPRTVPGHGTPGQSDDADVLFLEVGELPAEVGQ